MYVYISKTIQIKVYVAKRRDSVYTQYICFDRSTINTMESWPNLLLFMRLVKLRCSMLVEMG